MLKNSAARSDEKRTKWKIALRLVIPGIRQPSQTLERLEMLGPHDFRLPRDVGGQVFTRIVLSRVQDISRWGKPPLWGRRASLRFAVCCKGL